MLSDTECLSRLKAAGWTARKITRGTLKGKIHASKDGYPLLLREDNRDNLIRMLEQEAARR